MEFLADYGLFLAKTVTLVAALAAVIVIIAANSMKHQHGEKGHLEVTKLNEKFEDIVEGIKSVVVDETLLKAEEKTRKKQEKLDRKAAKKAARQLAKKTEPADGSEGADSGRSDGEKKRVFVTAFDGDIKASATEGLRQVITAVLALARPGDEVVVKLESQGGMVHSYGLASSQLTRITDKDIPLTVCVDKVAASGGYMMACVANKILCAPFAVIGSIGVVAQLPNFHRLLKKNDIDYEMLTAGEYKRTLTVFGENTEKGRQKFIEDLEDTHELFKAFIRENRDVVDVDAVATGEVWFGRRALDQKLVDEIKTSDQYLVEACEDADVFEIKYVEKKSLPEKLGLGMETAFDRVIGSWVQRFNNRFLT